MAKVQERFDLEREEEKERTRIMEQNRILEEQRRKEEEKKRREEELIAIEREKIDAQERERKRRLEEEEVHIKKLAETASLIKRFSTDIPVQLSRISELLKSSESEVEQLLIELLSYQDDLGEYLELEQVFIKRSKVNKNVDEVISKTKSNPYTAIHVCSVCNTGQSVLSMKCNKCDNLMPFCPICRRGFAEEDNLSSCSHCEAKFHSVHIFAYIQAKGMCPVCKDKLNEKLLQTH